MSESINFRTTHINQATYRPTPSSQQQVNLTHLNENLTEAGMPDLIGTLIRLIHKDAEGEFDLDVSHEKAILKLGGSPATTIVIQMMGGKWQKTVGNNPPHPVFQDLTQSTEYTKLTTLFIATLGRQRVETTSAAAPISNVQPLASSEVTASMSSPANSIPVTLTPSSETSHKPEEDIKTLRAKLEEQIKANETLQASIRKLEEKESFDQAHSQEIAQLKRQAEEQEKTISNLRNELGQKTKELITQQVQSEANINLLKMDHEQQITKLESQLAQAQYNLNLQAEKHAADKSQFEQKDTTLRQEFEEQLRQAEAKLRSTRKNLDREHAQLLQEKDQEIRQLVQELAEVTPIIKTTTKEIAQLNQSYKARVDELAQKEKTFLESQEQIAALQTEIKQLKKSQETIQAGNENLLAQSLLQKETITHKDQELASIQLANQQSERTIAELKAQLAQAHQESLTAYTQEEALGLGQDTSSDEINCLKRELEEEKTKRETLFERWQQTFDELERLRNSFRSYISHDSQVILEERPGEDLGRILEANEALERGNRELLEEIQLFEKRNKELQSSISNQNTRIQKLEDELRDRSVASEELRQKTDFSQKLEKEVEKLKQELAQAEGILTESQAEFESQLDSLKTTLSRLETDNQSLREALTKQSRDQDSGDSSIQLFKQQLAKEYEDDLQNLRDENEHLQTSNEKLVQQMRELIESQFKTLEETENMRLQFNTDVQNKYENTSQLLSLLSAEAEELKTTKKDILELTRKLQEEQNKTAAAYKSNQELLQETAQIRALLKETQEQNASELRKQLIVKDKEIQEELACIAELEDTLNTLKEELKTQTTFNQELDAALHQEKIEKKALEQEFHSAYEKLAQEKTDFEQANKELTQDILSSTKRIADLEQELISLKDTGRKSPQSPISTVDQSKKIEELNSKIDDLERANRQLDLDLTQARKEADRIQEAMDSSSDSDNELLNDSHLRHQRLEQQVDTLNESIRGMVPKEEVDKLQQELADKEEEIATRLAYIKTITEQATANIKQLIQYSEEEAKKIFLAILQNINSKNSSTEV